MYLRKNPSSDVIVMMTVADSDSDVVPISMSISTHDAAPTMSFEAPVVAVGDWCCRVDVAAIAVAAANLETGKDCAWVQHFGVVVAFHTNSSLCAPGKVVVLEELRNVAAVAAFLFCL
jgi:hypothetical protein